MSDDQHKRKTRTRGHVIADLGVNFVERQILLAGFVAERQFYDYGVDLEMKTFDASGQVEPGRVLFQVKATDHFARTPTPPPSQPASMSARYKGWLMDWTPVVLVLYHAQADRAHWLDVQGYARERDMDADAAGATVTLAIPLANVFDVRAVQSVRELKRNHAPPREE